MRVWEPWLRQPMQWTKPRRIFVCAHGDLFHESVDDETIDKVCAVMNLCQQHTFQITTKRPERARSYFTQATAPGRQFAHIMRLGADKTIGERSAAANRLGKPLPNVWMGTSVERQQEANERIPHILATPAAVRWVSAEPLLGPINFKGIACTIDGNAVSKNALDGSFYIPGVSSISSHILRSGSKIDWIIVGGESGPRPRDNGFLDNARDILAQCRAAGVAFFGKQNVGKTPLPPDLDVKEYPIPRTQ